MEAKGGSESVNAFVALGYKIGGKWGAASVMGVPGILCLAAAVYNYVNRWRQ